MDHGRFGPPGLLGGRDGAPNEVVVGRQGGEYVSPHLSKDEDIRVVAGDMRSQTRNRELAEERLADLVRRALIVPRKRRATKPTRAAKEARLDSKKRHSTKKRDRRGAPLD